MFWLFFALFVPNYFPYPGIASILPVMTAFFFILNLDSNLVSKFLSNNFFVSISKYSFLIYLVHWPVLILYRINYGVDNIDLKGGLLILFLTVIFCVLVKSISEIADLNRIKRVGQVFLVVILLIVVVLGVNSVLRDIERERNDSAYQDWYIKKETSQYSLNDTLKSIEGIGYFKPIQSCNAIDDNGDIKLCLYGNLDSDKIIYLVGSSHITQWVPLFKKFAEENNFKLVQITKGGCLLGDHFVSNVSYECSQWSKNTLDYLINDQYAFKNVVTLSTRTYLPNIKLDIIEDVPKSYIEGWKALKMSNFGSIKIFGIRDNPRFPTSPNLCLIRNVKDPDSCSFNKNHYLATFDPALKYSELVSSLDFNKFYCDKFNCKVYFNNIPIYRDDDHISDLYSFAIYENMKDLLLENFNNLKNK
ncbi:acyltransferase family protein [Acinetobacter indicus]|uniref:acyltransferase family protein n=1 Tax=Acinetobacter indicus TaxID=756892 RepID=UPI001443A359|nr:acyltransferase [Acinetobacter indicus]